MSFFELVYRILATLSLIFGIIFIPLELMRVTNSPLLAWSAVASVVLVLIVGAFFYSRPSRFLRRTGIYRRNLSVLVASSWEHASIATDYSAEITTRRTLIFLRDPKPDELVDVVELEPGNSIDETVYSTTDAVVQNVTRRSENAVAVHWRPRDGITLFAPYEHDSRYLCPVAYGPYWFWQGLHIDKRTGHVQFTFDCPEPVAFAVAFKMPRIRNSASNARVYKNSITWRRRDAPQPLVQTRRVEWELLEPEIGRTYICAVFYAGGFDALEQEYNASIVSRLRLAVS